MKRSKAESPKVTGLSPKEGPPGTKVTLRGENLGINAKDIVGVIICNVNCTLVADWISPSKIVCRTTSCKGLGDVIVATRSGGMGTCTVKFRGTSILPNPIQESAIWMDETSFFERRLKSISTPTSPMQGSDPLGLAETSPPMTDEELQEMFPGCSSNLAHKNFEPLLYLIENHSATSFQDLKKGLIHLGKQNTLKAEGPQTFIKSNLGTFMNCQDILAAIHESLQFHEDLGARVPPSSKPNGQGDGPEGVEADQDNAAEIYTLQKIEECLKQCNENAQNIFKSVLHRKDRADSTRNALNVLNRFKFLFHLPVNIERNIKKGDYEVVINDYERARQLFADTEVPVFKKVFQEVEKMIHDLRIQLEKKLMELPLPLENQKKLIRYLVELEAPGDPAWKCIDNQQQWLLKLLLKCKNEHLQIDQKHNQSESGSSLRPGKGHNRTHSGSQFKLITPDAAVVDISPPQRVLYLEELVEILQLTFTNMWKLGQSYFNAAIVAEAGGKDMQVDMSKKGIFEERITEVTQLFGNLIRAAFLPNSLNKMPKEKRLECGLWSNFESESPGAWLPQCVRNTRCILASFNSLDVPVIALKHIKTLVTELRRQCLTVLFTEATEDIHSFHARETWALQMDDHGGITTLPLLFESIVIDTLQHLKEVVTSQRSEENADIFDFDMTKRSIDLASDMLKSFAQCLDQLAFQPKTEADTRLQLTEAVQRAPESIFQKGEDSLPSMEQCLVIVLSNCSHVSEHITPNLIEQFKSHGYPKMLEVENNVLDAYAELDEKIFEAYCEQKTDPLVGALEPGMYEGHFDWSDCPKPSGVRAYVKEAIMIAIAIHAEVHAIAPAFMPRVMAQVLEAIADEMARLISCVTDFSAHGALQARLELAAIEEALNPYRNAGSSSWRKAFTVRQLLTIDSSLQQAHSSFQEAIQLVPALSASDKGLLQNLLSKFHSDLRFQLLCFTVEESVH